MSAKTLDIEDKNIDVAIERACREFGVGREKLNIEIISEGSNGFLGIGAKKAKIRASLFSFDMDFSLPDSARQTSPPEETSDGKPERKADRPTDKKPEARHEQRRHEAKPEMRNKPEHRHRRSVSPESGTSQPAAPSDKSPSPAVTAVEAAPATTPVALKAQELLAGMLSRMTFECLVSATETNETIILSIAGDDSGLLIGRRGQNLDALQYILNKSISKSETERKMIVVDSEEYRKRREESLLDMARRIREKVKKTQKPLSLSHMNAHDRRIIHLALQEDDELITKSRGEGEYRKVIVLPAKKSSAGGHPKAKNRQ
ncbi:MAG: Jag N-terminal domain-containing protein [Smithellaceae bacterium]|nr:Jag N-terminal domain-containing protein [Smithellaceae bacterium]